jgi:hypothetical protein
MSIEALLTRLAEALEENTKRLDAMLGSAKPAAAKPAATTEDKPAAAKPAAAKPAAAKPITVTAQDIADYAGESLKIDRPAAKKAHSAICEHFGADRLTNIDPKHFPKVMELMKAFRAGQNPLANEDEGDEEDGDSAI